MSLQLNDLHIDHIHTGDHAELIWQPVMQDVDQFAALSGDHNPLHMDDGWARSQAFDGRVVHGMLLAAKVSALVGMLLPGRRCLLLEYQLAHPNPVYVGEEVTIRGEVHQRWEDMAVIELKIKAVKSSEGKRITVARGTVRCKVL